MTTAIYPIAKIPKPSSIGFNLEPKNSKRSIVTERGYQRERKVSNGHRYNCAFTLSFKTKIQKAEFQEFLDSEINFGEYWFSADWLTILGYENHLFKIVSTSCADSGTYSTFKLNVIMRPANYTDQYGIVDTYNVERVRWENEEITYSPTCKLVYGSFLTDDGLILTDNGEPLTEFPVLTPMAPTVIEYDWGGDDIDGLPVPVQPSVGNIRWVRQIEDIMQAGDNYFSGDDACPTTTLWGESVASSDGTLFPAQYYPRSAGFIVFDDFDSEIKDAIKKEGLQFGFAFQHLFRQVSIYPRTQVKVEMIDCAGMAVFSKILLIKPDSTDWTRHEIVTEIPPNTVAIRIYFDFKRGDGTIVDIFARVDNVIALFKTCQEQE